MSPSQFDFLARHYNTMTGFPGRIDTLARQIQPWVTDWKVGLALDAGCGGGALMLALDRLGVTPVGLDSSEPMLRLGLANAREVGRRFQFCGTSFSMAGRLFPGRFDAVFCIGNSMVGAANDADLVASMTGLRNSLKPGGHLLIQLLNFAPFWQGRKTIIARRKIGEAEFVRAAVRDGDRLCFTALFLGADGETQLHVSRWIPWTRVQVSQCLLRAGFGRVEAFGSLDRQPFDEQTSTDLVLSAKNS